MYDADLDPPPPPQAEADIPAQTETSTPPRRTDVARRKALFAGLAGAATIAALGWGGWYVLVGAHRVETDNAYVGADTAQVTPLVSGAVRTVAVAETQTVRQGQVLVTLDDSDARIALASAEAELARAERRVKGYFATDDNLSAQVAARAADEARNAAALVSSQSDLERARIELDRRKALAAIGAVSGEELTRAQNTFTAANAQVASARAALAAAKADRDAARGAFAANAALTQGSGVADNPEVAVARARVQQAQLDLDRTVIRAPIDGVVVNRKVQVGQKVTAGAQILQIVPIQAAYVDANFKESQLRKVRIGQPVELTSDLYGASVVYHGKVAGLSGGAGSAFALIPAQNATGNWVKVVQRIPVRVRLDPAELKANPLRVGLSMAATIDTRR